MSSSKVVPRAAIPPPPPPPVFPAHLAAKPSLLVASVTPCPAAPLCCAVSACVQCCAHRPCPSFAEPTWVRRCPPRWSPVISWTQSALSHPRCFSFHVCCPLVLSLCLSLGSKSLVDTRLPPAFPALGHPLCLLHFSPIPGRSVQHFAAPPARSVQVLAVCWQHEGLIPALPIPTCCLPLHAGLQWGCITVVLPSQKGSALPWVPQTLPHRVLPPSQPLPSAVSAAPPAVPCPGYLLSAPPTNHSPGTQCSLAASQQLGGPMRPVVAVHRDEHSHTV